MGIVQRQSLKNSIVNYLGIIIGGLSTLFIYPLNWELYGEIQFSISTATLLSTFFALGSPALVNKYFPFFNVNKISGFLGLLFIYSSVAILLTISILYLFKSELFELLAKINFDLILLQNDLFIIFPIGILLVFITVLRAYCFNLSRIVVPEIINSFSLKIIVPIIVLLGYFNLIGFTISGWILIFSYLLMGIVLLFYIQQLRGLDFKLNVVSKIKRSKHIEMIRYMLYGGLNQTGTVLVYKIDLVMIGLLLPIEQVGYYSIFLFLSIVMEVPTKAILQIVPPIVSDAFERKDKKKIQSFYTSSSINLYIIGIGLFLLIWLNMRTFFAVMTSGEELSVYKYIFLVLALTKIIDMITSINSDIIAYSNYFRVNTLFLILLAVVNVFLNYLFIQQWGAIGAALSTCIAMLLFNVLKTIFIAIKLKMHPFNRKMIGPTFFLIISVFLPIIFPDLFQHILFSILISIGLIICYIFYIYKRNTSPEIIEMVAKYRKMIFKKHTEI